MSLTSLLLLMFCCCPQASGAIYQSVYSSSTCSGTPTTTYKLTSTKCVVTANGRQSTNVYVSTAGLPTAGATYTVASYSASCGSPTQLIAVTQTPSCTSSGTCQPGTGGFGAVTISCPSSGTGSGTGSSGSGSGTTVASGPGSVTTGYAVQSILFAASDMQCNGQLFTSAQGYVLGVCIVPGGTSSIMFTSDVRCICLCFSKVSFCHSHRCCVTFVIFYRHRVLYIQLNMRH